MRDGTDTFDGMFHDMEVECKQKQSQQQSQQCRNEYGSALFMRPEEKQISFYNRYFIFRKNRNINAKHLKSSFLTYAGLQEEQDRGMAGTAAGAAGAVLDEATEKIALDKIARASVPIDVASKPAIAAHIIQSRGEEAVAAAAAAGTAATGTGSAVRKTIKVKPKPTAAAAAAAKKAEEEAAAAAEAEGAAAPIEQIEKTIKKRTKKATIIEDVPPAPPAAAVAKAPRKKTEKATEAAAEKKKTKKKVAGDE
jgi:hypothetical protein